MKSTIDLDTLRQAIRPLGFVFGTPEQIADWHRADADLLHNKVIEGVDYSIAKDALFGMLRDEAVPSGLATQIVLRLHDHRDADPALAITQVRPRSCRCARPCD